MKQRILCLNFLFLCLASLANALPSTQSGASPTQNGGAGGRQKVDEAERQIQDFYDEKESRTPAQRKLNSQLLYALKQKRGETRGVPTRRIDLKPDAKGRVLVDISARVSARLVSRIKRLGGEVVSTSEKYQTARAWLALEKLEALATMSDVRFIAPVRQPMTNVGPMTN